MKMEKYPKDLLERIFVSSGEISTTISQTQQNQNTQHQQQYLQHLCENREEEGEDEEEEEDEGVELNLGLSLGGRFGVDKYSKNKKLMRSSSVVGTMPLLREDIAAAVGVASPTPGYPILVRASSLPTETEEEWKKRKELQTLRRMEAKRRRLEKQRVSKSERDLAAAVTSGGGGGPEEIEGGGVTMVLNRSSVFTSPFGLHNWGVGTKQVVVGDVLGKGKIGIGFQGLFAQPSSQGSVDSQGGTGSSSSLSEMDSKPFLGSSSCGEAKSPASNQSKHERSSQDAVGSSGMPKKNDILTRTTSRAAEVTENASKKPHPNIGKEIGTNSMEDMPCVFTKGDGPNGRRIEGILYKYGKGEEVRIMCVCHGNFLSPAEFVKHAGGSDVAHPLRHIVVNPSAPPLL